MGNKLVTTKLVIAVIVITGIVIAMFVIPSSLNRIRIVNFFLFFFFEIFFVCRIFFFSLPFVCVVVGSRCGGPHLGGGGVVVEKRMTGFDEMRGRCVLRASIPCLVGEAHARTFL